ncbi:hypothetical protein BD311DRAFT_670462 [Dichomitus squalens]|uniref:Deoxyribonuclease NucA/NucB domain-containing protein n=1 Tax=Dichomitus squalens TaxID=114155 RepID=A0A4V2JZK8_9APHY|nr:hypothetical protein BD311DRAFT_670462 [Dichomitus squalens]
MLLSNSPILLAAFSTINAVALSKPVHDRGLSSRATANGTCISAPEDSCLSLVGLCVTGIASGQVSSTAFWSDRTCTAAATCAGIGAVLDAACCAGTCHQPTDISSLDYSNIYFGMVGDCAFQPGGCSLTWQPFVDWFYNTIQATDTNIYPDDGDLVLGWWADIATWTDFCEGDSCADSAIPYTNFNDWFHFSSAVSITTPGTPQYVPPLSTDRDLNEDDWSPDFSWPCPFDDPDDCWWDYGPPTAQTTASDDTVSVSFGTVKPNRLALSGGRQPVRLAAVPAKTRSNGTVSIGRAPNQPPNVPPPTWVNGQPLVLHLNGTQYVPPKGPPPTTDDSIMTNASYPLSDLVQPLSQPKAAITPDLCDNGQGLIDTPTTLPTLSYYCNLLPNICANIASHPAFTNPMILTYDPFNEGQRRNAVCPKSVRDTLQAAGKCDVTQHNPAYWKVSCDEFPFNSALEGGAGNAVVAGVPTREQQYQATLQSSITHLLRVAKDKRTVWHGATGKMCHRYQLVLLNGPESGAPANAVGSLDGGSAFFANNKKVTNNKRFLTNRLALAGVPTPSPPADYPPTAGALYIMRNGKTYDCRPCTIGSINPPPRREISAGDEDVEAQDGPTANVSISDSHGVPPTKLSSRIAAHVDIAELGKRQGASSCVTATQTPTSTAAAVADSGDDIAAAQTAISSASAILSATPPSGPAATAAAAAVAAAAALPPAAASLTTSTSDSAFAAAVAAAAAAVEAAQDSISSILSLGTLPDSVSQVVNHLTSASSSISSALTNTQNVINPQTPIPPNIDPAKNPNYNAGPPPGIPAAACFGAGSNGFLKLGDTYVSTNTDGTLGGATLVDAGSDAFFGLRAPADIPFISVTGCSGVYGWGSGSIGPDFQVDCSTNELGSYWNGAKQTCYYFTTPGPTAGLSEFFIVCGDNLGNIYSCLQGSGMYETLNPAFVSWATTGPS